MSRPDSLGQLRLSEQTWYDVETRRPIQRREILQLGYQMKYKREFRTTTITYIDDGPADIYALGVPAGTPIVDEETREKVASPPALQEVFSGAARVIERLPRSVRVVEDGDAGLQLTYWAAAKGYLEAWADFVRDRNDSRIHATGAPRSFFADHQGSSGAEMPAALRTRPEDDLPADALAAWLPVEQSVNVHLKDGTRGYDLTRFITAPDKPKDVRVHVHRDDSSNLPPGLAPNDLVIRVRLPPGPPARPTRARHAQGLGGNQGRVSRDPEPVLCRPCARLRRGTNG